MARFVLVHGGWQAKWCWQHIVPGLLARGHAAVTFDLPGHGADDTPPESVTMQHYVDRIGEEIHASEDAAILVGHSMGGVISQAAEAAGKGLRALVYVAALVPADGVAMMQFVSGYDAAFLNEFVWDSDQRTARITPEGARNFLYTHCPTEDIESALPLFTAEPAAPFAAPMALTAQRYGQIPRFYIECLRDRAVTIALQRSMQTTTAFNRVYSLDSDHSPFFSMPEELVRILDEISRHPHLAA